MEKNQIYPDGIKKETDEFAERKKIKQLLGDTVESVVKDETKAAYEKMGYKEKDGYLSVIAVGDDRKEREVGKGVAEGKVNVTISKPKMLNPGAAKPVSYMQKVTSFGGKRIISEIYMEIVGETLSISYKNTEAAAFQETTIGNTYAPKKIEKNITISNISSEKELKSKLKKFFKEIVEKEAEYLTGTKIGIDDKIQKNMNDSIVKENKLSLKELISESFEDAAEKIGKITSESLEEKDTKKNTHGTPDTSSGEPTDKKVILGSEEGEEKKVEEMTTSAGGSGTGTAGAFGYQTPYAFAKDGKTKEFKANKQLGYTPVPMSEATKNTNYGKAKQKRASLVKEADGAYNVKVEMEPGYLNVPKGMTHPYTMGLHGKAEVNSEDELKTTGHGDLNKVDKFKDKIQLQKRKFITKEENKKLGINERYIITEKLSKEEETKRWKQLCESGSFDALQDNDDIMSRKEFEDSANETFEANNTSIDIESHLESTPACGCEDGMALIPKGVNSLVIFKIAEADLKQNKTYVIDHFTNKLVLNPKFQRLI